MQLRIHQFVDMRQHGSPLAARLPVEMQTKNKFGSVGSMQAKRAEYWDTQPHYGGDRGAASPVDDCSTPVAWQLITANVNCNLGSHACAVIWDALKAAAASDLGTAAVILDSAGIVVSAEDMTVCYDERGQPL